MKGNKTVSLSIFSLSLIILFTKTESSIYLVLGLIGGLLATILEIREILGKNEN